MISEAAAFDLLRPLALPTLTALTAANAVTERMRAVSDDARRWARGPLLATSDGSNFWTYFASALWNEYDAVPGVERVLTAHPLVTEWRLPGGVLLRLKSDVAAVDGSQLSLDVDVPSIGGEIIVLTYDHNGPERIAPTFMQPLSRSHLAWTWSAGRLLSTPATEPQVLRTPRPKTTVTSTKAPSEQVAPPADKTVGEPSPDEA